MAPNIPTEQWAQVVEQTGKRMYLEEILAIVVGIRS